MKKLGIIIYKVTDIVTLISFVGAAVLLFLNVADVILTKVFVTSIVGAYEISENVLLVAVFASFAYGQTRKTHIHMTLFLTKLPKRFKMIPYTLGSLLSAAMAVFFTYATFYRASSIRASHAETSMLHIPTYPFYYVCAISLILFTITILYEAALSIIAIFRKDYAELVSANW
jgi:TRAP-type C4-dicarboxylate transport system permease small subunit